MVRRGWSRWGLVLVLAGAVACDDGEAPAAVDEGAAGGDRGPAVDAGPGSDAGPTVGPCGATPESLAACVDVTRFGAALELVARPRLPGSAHWQRVQDECATAFEAAGFEVERHAYGTGVNVIGVKPGLERPEERVIISAHYDHLAECAGADDNASGTAGVIEAARVLGQASFARTLVVACWDEEEFGLIGSRAYAQRAQAAGDQIRAGFVLEMIGYKDEAPNTQILPEGFELLFRPAVDAVAANDWAGDFIALLSHEGHASAHTAFMAQAEAQGVRTVLVPIPDNLLLDPLLGQLRRSDHAPFWEAGFPSMMIGDTANFRNPFYHCSRGEDDIATVDVDWAARVTAATIGAAAQEAGVLDRLGEGAPLTPPPTPAPQAPACDPLANDCPGGERCTLVFESGRYVETCLPFRGAGALGEDCQRPGGGSGDDTCGQGLFCAFWGLPQAEPQPRRCLALCTSDADCAADENCIRLGGSRPFGACTGRCDPLGDDCVAGTACVTVAHVDRSRTATYCFHEGPSAPRALCPEPCVPGSQCHVASGFAEARCAPFCRADGDCLPEERCFPIVPQAGLPPGTGRCLAPPPG